jgi:hypothetical protein
VRTERGDDILVRHHERAAELAWIARCLRDIDRIALLLRRDHECAEILVGDALGATASGECQGGNGEAGKRAKRQHPPRS